MVDTSIPLNAGLSSIATILFIVGLGLVQSGQIINGFGVIVFAVVVLFIKYHYRVTDTQAAPATLPAVEPAQITA